MEDNSKLFVFDKKEVILIFVFMVLITITSFTIGVRFGKSISLKADGFTQKDLSTIDLKSVEEERVDSITGDQINKKDISTKLENSSSDSSESSKNIEDDQYMKETELRIREEINKLANPANEAVKKKITNLEEEDVTASSVQKNKKFDELYRPEVKLSGKFTIQLASFESKEEAQSFADGFIASGYDAIVNEVAIPGKGTWYRVSVGLFDTLNEAKNYLDKESKFFQGKDYLIKKFK